MTRDQLHNILLAWCVGRIKDNDLFVAVEAYSSASNGSKPDVSGSLPVDSELEDWLFDGYERTPKNLERLKIGRIVRDRIAQKLNSGNDR